MSLVDVTLPAPSALRGRWAASAAVLTSLGFADSCRADGNIWHYDDGGGNWAELIRVEDGRALLIGNDHEYSETYFREAATELGEPETNLLADAPPWWGAVLDAHNQPDRWVGFVYGFEDGSWRRADYDLDDGFDSLGLPAVDTARCQELIFDFTAEATKRRPTAETVAALIAADGDIDVALLATVVDPGQDITAGVAAARRFLATVE